MNELISVIVPIYNVEKYLDKCIESIVNQTYKNLEIILIDDESPDNSPKMCDKWLKKDKRIKVIHKKNGGLSDARNVGLKIAAGDYIGFVDSDDYIDSRMYEILLSNIKKYNAGISICSYVDEYDSGKTKIGKHFDEKIVVLDKMDALQNLILEQNITNHAWNKLYKKELFDGIEFPVGRKMEDVATMYKLFERTNTLVCSNYIGYHYIQRDDSIMGNINKKLIEDNERSVFDRNEYIKNKYPELRESVEIENIKTYKLLHYLAVLGNQKDLLKSKKYKIYYEKYKKNYIRYRKQIKNNVGNRVILSFDLFWFSKKLYYLYLNHK